VSARWHVGFASDVFASRCDEDGELRDELCFFVMIEEEATGRRWRSRWHVTTQERSREACEQLAMDHEARVSEALDAGADPRRSDRWFATAPCYGSAAYDGRAERNAEIDAAYVAGEIDYHEASRLMGMAVSS
jgi:hypothetical protein